MGGAIDHAAPENRTSATLARIETALVAVSAVAMAAIMFVVTVDVVLRYAFASPLSWSYGLIGLYLVPAVFFLALSDTLHHHGHIALDVFQALLPLRLRHICLAAGYAASAAFVAVITWLGHEQAVDAFLGDDRIASTIPWPTWIGYAILTAGSAALTLRCLYRAVYHAASAVAGRDLVEVPPPPCTDVGAAEHGE